MSKYRKAKQLRYRDCITYLETSKEEKLARFEDSDVPPFVVNEFMGSVDSVLDELRLLMDGSHAISSVEVKPDEIRLTKKVKEAMIRKKIVNRECFVSPKSYPDNWVFLNGLNKMSDNLLLSIVKANRGSAWIVKQLEHVDDPKWHKDTKTFLRGRKGQNGKVGLALLFLFDRHQYLFKGKGDHEFMNLARVGAAKWSKAPPNVKRLYQQVKNMNSSLDRTKGAGADVSDA